MFRPFRKKFRSFGGRRRRFSAKYDVQRFHLCRNAFQVGGDSCDTQISNVVVLLAPGADASAALNPIIPGPVIDPITKGVTLGGIRFWLEWAYNTTNIPAGWLPVTGVTLTMMSMLAFIAKVPVDPETNALAYIPAPMINSHQGDRATRENLLWTRLFHVPFSLMSNPPSEAVMSSTGSVASSDGVNFQNTFTANNPVLPPYLVKTKRTLGEYDALVFGIASVVGIQTGGVQMPMAIDLYGQMAIKRSRRTGL